MDKLIVGKVVKIHGVKGAIKVVPIIDNEINFSSLKGVFIDNDTNFHEFEEVFAVSDMLGIKLKDINDVNKAKSMVGKFLYAEKSVVESLTDGESFFMVWYTQHH